MVCEKCQAKLNRVICPDVAKKPMSKMVGAAAAAASEEKKEESKFDFHISFLNALFAFASEQLIPDF